ncbi:hypothetical protein H6503_04125 [Candidatus Woesearchaeota archaeon]|nr:hypothetical protein [Candidatus Woesearchaeota archaeon]
MEPRLLEGIGLTEAETRVYLALAELGSTKTGPLSTRSKVSYSKIYKILYRLEQKGLVGHIVKGKVKFFKAMEPSRILDYVDEKSRTLEQQRAEIEKALPELESIIPSDDTPESITYYGFKAIKNLLLSMIEELKGGGEYYVLGAMYGEVIGVRPFYKDFHSRRTEKRIKVKMLANPNVRGSIEPETLKDASIRYMPTDLITNMNTYFYNDIAIIILWIKEPIAFYMKSRDAVRSFRTYFDTFWKISKV